MKKSLSTIILMVTFTFSLGAEGISLDECLSLARSNYPEIKKFDIIRITEECDFSNASLTWMPSVKLGVWGSLSNQSNDLNDIYANAADPKLKEYCKDLIQNYMGVLSPIPWRYGAGLEISQNIYDGGASSASKNEAAAKAQMRNSEINCSLENVEKKVEELFFSILLLTERQKQMTSKKEVLERNRDKIMKMVQAGNSSTLSVKIIQAELVSLLQQMDVLEGNVSAYKQALTLFIGRNVFSLELEMPEMPDISGKSIYDTPAMRMLEDRIRFAQAKEKLLDASLRPRLALLGNLSYGYPGSNVFKSMTSHDPLFESILGVRFVWDITPFYTKRNNAVKIQNEVQMLNIERESLIFNTRIENTSLNSQIAQMKKTMEQDNELLELRTEIRQIEEARLENGDTDMDSFLNKVSEESIAALAKSIHSIELMQYYYQYRHNGHVEP